jgi:thiosulfate/3-mercaptopyruvate sulfurtransferase
VHVIEPVVDSDWLKQHSGDIVIADVRWYLDGRSGIEAYETGHLPGAIFVDLDEWLSGTPGPTTGRHPLPSPERFAEGMARSGISDADIVIAYDDAGGVIAARLVWMLRVTGHEAALLDGGLGVFEGPLELGTVVRAPASFEARAWPEERLANIDDATNRANVVVDARNRDRYRGDFDPVDARSGHIPGAHNIPCRENLTSAGTFLPRDEIRKKFVEVGVVNGNDVVSYCGSGVTACHNLLALELVGLGRGRLFPGSWSQFSHASEESIATGDAPG